MFHILSITNLESLSTGVVSLVAHDLVLDASIIDLYSDIKIVQMVAGIKQSNINTLDASYSLIKTAFTSLINILKAGDLSGVLDASFDALLSTSF